jgi:hypothetical protein
VTGAIACRLPEHAAWTAAMTVGFIHERVGIVDSISP